MIYKIRVILDAKESIFRDVEIKDKQTLWNLHLGIKSAFSLQGDELSSFYYTNEEWEEGQAVPLEDMSDDGDGETMSDVYLREGFPAVGSKMLFKYGFIDLWEFFCELLEIAEEKPSVNYPITVYRFGNVPLKAPAKGGSSNPKGASSLGIMDDDFADLDNDFGSEFDSGFDDDEEEDDFNDGYYDEKIEDDKD
ncbi:MAG: hypothetical protein KBA33_01440 [Cloacibacterium sp.]|nr:hypothetical protein [Cloacibacterium sp.]